MGGGDEEREEACGDAVIRIFDGGGRRQYPAAMLVRSGVLTVAEIAFACVVVAGHRGQGAGRWRFVGSSSPPAVTPPPVEEAASRMPS